MEMDKLKIVIHPSEYEQLVKGNIDSLFIILHKSNNELHDLTHLPLDVIETIKTKAVDIVCNKKFITANQVPAWERIRTDCSSIDSVLSGGIPVIGITEIYGCSGAGKTQLCLQLALTLQLPNNLGGKEKGTVYICTEDVFPSKRFHQLSDSFKSRYNLQELDFETSVYLDHSADFEQLRRCLCVRLPRLLQVKNIGLLVIDSIAGIFRSENNDICYTSRGQEIGLLASTLHRICDQYKIAVVCVNQVTDNVLTRKTDPSLGLAWGNNVTCRFCITRCDTSGVRNFEVVLAPDLPNSRCSFKLTEDGVAVP